MKSSGNISGTTEIPGTPRTDWEPTDRFNIEDYNRIKRNLEYLRDRVSALCRFCETEDMGGEKNSYEVYFYAREFNLFEKNLEAICRQAPAGDCGTPQQFFDNGPFIGYEELNRIEGAILSINRTLDDLEACLPRLEVRLGYTKGIKI